jgi:hypothetical protein
MAGFKDATAFMNEITPEIEQQVMQQASQEKADPNTQAAEILAQVEREKAQLRAQTEAAKVSIQSPILSSLYDPNSGTITKEILKGGKIEIK